MTSGNLQTPRYDAQVEGMGDRLYNISKNLGYSDESIASGYGLIQAVGGEVTGMNMIAEAYEGYDLGENRALETDERVIKAAVGTAQAAGTVAAGLKITGVNPKITHSRNLPKNLEYSAKVQEHLRNPNRFVPQSIIREVIRKGKALPDPRGSNATMYYSRIWKNGQLYNIEVLYAPSTNTVWHVMYTRSPIGPLPAIL